ncbi:MAG: hypothetical protein RL308_635 [Bacteroidota bacterium]|jgi:hypothetical protein
MNQPSPYIITICNKIESQLGFKIKNIADAEKVSGSLASEKLHISPHTIARLFGVVKPFRIPYKETLNVLARYLNYNDWEDFCANQTNIPFDPNFYLTEASDGFSLAVLQLALATENFIDLKVILAKAQNNENEAVLFTAAELIGAYVRKSKKQKELLQLLAESSIGNLFFYECYVDENNENNYFSEALINHYLPRVANDYKKLFAYSFNISQTAHKKQLKSTYISEFEKLTNQLDKRKCHFHELSRWIECLILIDGLNGILKSTWENHLTELIGVSVDYNEHEKTWLFSRSLKAILLFGIKEELYNFNPFNEIIDNLIKNQKKNIYSIALYALQLYWISKSLYFNNKIIYTPFRIHNILFQNESNEKTAIEFALASLFAKGENKTILDSNLKKFCEEKGTTWVLKLITS